MSMIRIDAECYLSSDDPEYECYATGRDQAKRVLILLDALEEVINMPSVGLDHAWVVCRDAIAKAEEV